MSSEWKSALVALAVSVAIILAIIGAIRLIRGARQKPSGAGAVGWALLFLTWGRMPPPPPASQIEEATRGEKDAGASRNVEDP